MSKKLVLAILLCGIVLGTFASCTKEKPEGDKTQQQEVVKTDEEIRLETVAGEPEKAVYNFSSTPKVQRSLKGDNGEVLVSVTLDEPVVSAANRAFKEQKKKIETVLSKQMDLYNEIASGMMSSYDNSSEFKASWKLETDYSVKRNDGKVLSILQQVYIDQGDGAYFMNSALNFDVLTGDLIQQVFFTNGNDAELDAMDDLLYKKLTEKYPEAGISYEYVNSSFVDSAIDTWYFTNDGIYVFYNAESIAPEVMGDFNVTVTKDELPEFAKGYFID